MLNIADFIIPSVPFSGVPNYFQTQILWRVSSALSTREIYSLKYHKEHISF